MEKKNKRLKSAAICNVTGGLLLVLVILLCVPLTVPRLLGCQIYTVVSGSMEPAIPTGSIVYVKGTEASEIKKDDVIAFYSGNDSGAIITHRVVKNQVVSGQFITKGDANEKEDVTPVAYDNLIGKVVFSIPVLGSMLAVVTQPLGKAAVVCLIVAAVLIKTIGERLQKNYEKSHEKKM